ncbi:hypothetical protein D3C87_1335300 [compost metagenome]
MDLLAADVHQRFRAAQHAGRGAADLNVGARANRLQLELRIEGRHFHDADIGHIQHVGDFLDGGAGNPAVLLLRTHEQRDNRRLLASLWIFLDRLFRPNGVIRIEGKCHGLELIFG